MTLEELLQEIGIEKIHLDNFAQDNPRLKYNIVIEEYNEPYDKWTLNKLEVKTIDNIGKQIILN